MENLVLFLIEKLITPSSVFPSTDWSAYKQEHDRASEAVACYIKALKTNKGSYASWAKVAESINTLDSITKDAS